MAPAVSAEVAVPPADEKPAEKPAAEKESKRAATAAVKPGADTSIRVGVDKVDQLINLVGELVITQAMLAQSAAQIDPVEFERLHNGLIQLERNTRDLQESVMSIRMMPISVVFSRFPRVVRDVSQKLGKQVELKLSGENTELDKGLIERISDPLTHLIRNSLDHGIESPDVRAAKGKQPVGTITLAAYHQSGNIVIEVGDDGAGLPRNKILAKAKEKGLNVHDQMTDQEVFQLIFEAGFSTADQITEVSGRGVGMDVVKRNITAMGGRVEISSMLGVGTRMTVRLPLTLAILDGMSVAVGKEIYIIPLGYVIESLAGRTRHDEERLGRRTPHPGARRIPAGGDLVRGLPRAGSHYRFCRRHHDHPRNRWHQGRAVCRCHGRPASGRHQEPRIQLPQSGRCVGRHHHGRWPGRHDSRCFGAGQHGAPCIARRSLNTLKEKSP